MSLINMKPKKQKPSSGGSLKKSNAWNQVPIGEEFFNNKEFENLVSLEVLTDYTITNANGVTGTLYFIRVSLYKKKDDLNNLSYQSH